MKDGCQDNAIPTCECEHDSHFDGDAHEYGKAGDCELLETPYGSFWVCPECIKAGHMRL
jgi:hypothetical protein